MAIIDSKSDAKFDALIRTNKADSLMSFIMATFNTNVETNRKNEVAHRLKSAYELFRENVKGTNSGAGSYGQGERDVNSQFESHYTMGYEMGIWQDSNFTLNPLAAAVAEYKITVSEYIGTVFINLFTYYTENGQPKYHHFLYEVLKNAKNEGVIKTTISKSLIVDTLPQIEKKTEQGNILFNYLISTNLFEKLDKDNLILSREWIDRYEYLMSLCNLEFQYKDPSEAYDLAKDKKKYADYVTNNHDMVTENEVSSLEDDKTTLAEEFELSLDNQLRVTGGSNVIIYGVPGAGKSWTIDNEYTDVDTVKFRVVFHPDYTYSDFVGQILPVTSNGDVSYVFTPGPFTKIVSDAYRNPMSKYVLIIEEINRGNAPAIFGDIFQLLDRCSSHMKVNGIDKYGESVYGIINTDIANIIYGDSNHEIKIPSNMSIICTMNTSDQNVFTLDTAFQRRWNMRLIENSFKKDTLEEKTFAEKNILDSTVTWEHFCETVNDLILEKNQNMTSSEDKRLGTHFVNIEDLEYDAREFNKDETNQNKMEARIKNRKFPEKVIKYLWDDAFKFYRDEIFREDFSSLEKIIKEFTTKIGNERFNIFKDAIKADILVSK